MSDVLPNDRPDLVTFEDLAEYADRVGLRPEKVGPSSSSGFICCRLFVRDEGEQASITVRGDGLAALIRKAMPMVSRMLREGWRLT